MFDELGGQDAYEILAVPPTATPGAISRAKRSRLSTAHPDAGATSDHLAKLITSAAAILLDPDRRREYDRWRARDVPIPGPGPGPAPSYGSPDVMPLLGQPPRQYYHQPQPARSRTGLILLIIGGGVLLLCLGSCLLNGLAIR